MNTVPLSDTSKLFVRPTQLTRCSTRSNPQTDFHKLSSEASVGFYAWHYVQQDSLTPAFGRGYGKTERHANASSLLKIQ